MVAMPEIPKTQDHQCPRFDPRKLDKKEIAFDKKWFAKEHVTSIFHAPINFGAIVEKMMRQAKAMGTRADEFLMLTDESSPFGADVYLAVKRNTPGLACGMISGKFHTKVFEGPHSNIGKWTEGMRKYVNGKGKGVMRMLFFYPKCPDCARKSGKNYTVIFAQTE